jgi:hypothetical protein
LVRLRWRASGWCDAFLNFFFYIFLVDPPPLSQVAIPASHGLQPLTGAWVGTIVRVNPVRRPPKYWLPLRRGLGVDIFFFYFFHLFLQRVNNKSNTSPYPPSHCNRRALSWTHLLRLILSSWLPSSFTCQYKEWLSEHLLFFKSALHDLPLYFCCDKKRRSFHAASRYLLLMF